MLVLAVGEHSEKLVLASGMLDMRRGERKRERQRETAARHRERERGQRERERERERKRNPEMKEDVYRCIERERYCILCTIA